MPAAQSVLTASAGDRSVEGSHVVSTGHVWLALPLLLIPAAIILTVVLVVTRIGRGAAPAAQRPMLSDRRECPACKEWMRRDASICPHCRTPSEPWSFQDGHWWVTRGDTRYYLDEASGAWQQAPQPPPG